MPTIDTSIFQRSGTRAPHNVTDAIRRLCAEISPGQEPAFVRALPDTSAVPNECFNNVSRKVSLHGGSIVYGWAIWEWPRVFVEAEHHAVWLKGRHMVDITPHTPPCEEILFLPDPKRIYDYDGRKRLINIKRAFGNFPAAEAWIAATDKLQRYMEDCSDGDIITMKRDVLRKLFNDARQKQAIVLIELARMTQEHDPCFCQSGHKFENCCSPLINLDT